MIKDKHMLEIWIVPHPRIFVKTMYHDEFQQYELKIFTILLFFKNIFDQGNITHYKIRQKLFF